MVIRAIKTIAEGEPINENYGPIFTQKPREMRQRMLKERYWVSRYSIPQISSLKPAYELAS